MQISRLLVFRFSRFPLINNKSDCIRSCKVLGFKLTIDVPTFWSNLANSFIDISDTFTFLSRQNYAATELEEKHTGEANVVSTVLGERC